MGGGVSHFEKLHNKLPKAEMQSLGAGACQSGLDHGPPTQAPVLSGAAWHVAHDSPGARRRQVGNNLPG